MKRNKKMFWTVVIFLAFGFFGKADGAWAGCCVGTNGNCENTSGTSCSQGTYDSKDCNNINTCRTTGGCCVDANGNCEQADGPSTCKNGSYTMVSCDKVFPACKVGGGGSGDSGNSGTGSTVFVNPIAFSTVEELLDSILNNLMGIIAILAVIFIVIGGIMYLTSGGDENQITRAKKTWTSAVIGLTIALAAPTFLKEIRNILGGEGTGGSAKSWVSNALTIRQIAVNVLTLLLDVVGIFAIIAMVIGGGMYLTAYGDEKKIDKGKTIIKWAIIGIAVALASLVIIRQVDNLLRGQNSSSTGITTSGSSSNGSGTGAGNGGWSIQK